MCWREGEKIARCFGVRLQETQPSHDTSARALALAGLTFADTVSNKLMAWAPNNAFDVVTAFATIVRGRDGYFIIFD